VTRTRFVPAAAAAIALISLLSPPLRAQGWFYGPDSSLRLQVSPRDAEVFVDGYYAGIVDDFDGVFQRLRLEPGPHEIVVYFEGYRSHHEKIYLQPGRSFEIKHTMEPLGPGEVQEPKPVPPPQPAARQPAPAPDPSNP